MNTAGEIEHLGARSEILNLKLFGPIIALFGCLAEGIAHAGNVLGRNSQGIRDNADAQAGYSPAYSPYDIYYLDPSRAALDTGSAGSAGPDILAGKIYCPELRFVHDAANEKTPHQIPGTSSGAKTALVTQFERFTTGLKYHICSFFVRA